MRTGWSDRVSVLEQLVARVREGLAARGALAVLRGRTWPAMGRRYERTDAAAPAAAAAPARARTDEDRAVDAWKALDRGDDPTEDPTEAPGRGV